MSIINWINFGLQDGIYNRPFGLQNFPLFHILADSMDQPDKPLMGKMSYSPQKYKIKLHEIYRRNWLQIKIIPFWPMFPQGKLLNKIHNFYEFILFFNLFPIPKGINSSIFLNSPFSSKNLVGRNFSASGKIRSSKRTVLIWGTNVVPEGKLCPPIRTSTFAIRLKFIGAKLQSRWVSF